ncbi:unnamed protein product [Bursaphelenchus okinawaensis]|uniref:Mos1 transposase HTH domain-containing protein n=1 Tax=Bursaphelenchus okinawaensis TaxID=465554 RepID=A0A811LH21_9BILA|nr:unnamed protein product [Bursaphelenchus okinawaensis]CAG9123667.1 unnamed protein product [Bursaphelenchus okinawaensis]
MNPDLIDCRHIVFYEFKQNTSPTECTRKINNVFGERTVTFSTVFRWYQKFQKGDWDLSVKPRSKQSKFSINARKRLVELVREKPSIDISELADKLCICMVVVQRELDKMGIVMVKGRWEQFVDLATPTQSQGVEAEPGMV